MIGHGSAAAVAALSAAVRAEPGRADLWSELATALVAAGRPPEAWPAAVRAVELAPRSAAAHRAIGAVAAALGDSAQAESAYRNASLLDTGSAADVPSPDPGPAGGGRHASDRATAAAAWMASQVAIPDPRPPADSRAPNGSRHAAPEDPPATGRHGVPEPSTGRRVPAALEWPAEPRPSTGRRRAREDSAATAVWPGAASAHEGGPATALWLGEAPARDGGSATAVWPGAAPARDGGSATAVWPGAAPAREDSAATAVWPGAAPALDGGPATAVRGASTPGGEASWPEAAGSAGAEEVQRTAVGLPGWLGPVGPTPGPDGWARAASTGATRVADPVAWRRGLIAVVRIEWLVGVLCFLGLAYARTAPYTAGLLAGALVVAGAYGRLRWKASAVRHPPEALRVPTYAAIAAVATAVVIIPAAMAGALTLARVATVAAVTCATVAAVLLARLRG